MYVFRDGRRNTRGATLLEDLEGRISGLSQSSTEEAVLGALISAGELECALADADADSLILAKFVTDKLAQLFLMSGSEVSLRELGALVRSIQVPETVSVAVAEGFAYYALHPFRFRDPIRELATEGPVRVIGIRSIGTTLSAVVQALFATTSSSVDRITVRPHGHPYDRKLELTLGQQRWLRDAGREAVVIIVDEGPGLSGSSFLSVAEAVEASGIDRSQVVMLGSRYPEPEHMRAPDGVNRWPRYRFLATYDKPLLPDGAEVDLTGGLWRRYFWQEFENQPATWAHLELAKYMSHDRQLLYKFHGYGHFGEKIRKRAVLAGERGFAPRFHGDQRGFGIYQLIKGHLLTRNQLTPVPIQRAASYCVFRRESMQVSRDEPSELEAMAKWNWQCEFGNELKDFSLPVEHRVIADARMLPHEWLHTESGEILKLDGSSHGDDHFFPGPCDIAWDLAGTIVEWRMDSAQSAAFLSLYRQESGDDAERRIRDYVLAYAIFRMGWSKMAAKASAGTFDEKLLFRDYHRYRAQVLAVASRRGRTKPRDVGPLDENSVIAA